MNDWLTHNMTENPSVVANPSCEYKFGQFCRDYAIKRLKFFERA